MKKLIYLFVLGIAFVACTKEEEAQPDNTIALTATLSGSEEVPAVTTTATGTFTGSFNPTTKILTYTLTYAGMTPSAWHIHTGAKGANGGIAINFGTTFATPYAGITAALTAQQETDLLAGNMYANMHSTKNPGGEIRGQISRK
jgi:hypothetical protein